MRVPYWSEVGGPETRYAVVSYGVVEPLEPCCRGMENNWGHLIDLCCPGAKRTHNVRAGMLTNVEVADATHSVFAPISHCPWCGAGIELVPTKTVPPSQASEFLSDGDEA